VLAFLLWKVPITWVLKNIFAILYRELLTFVVGGKCCGKVRSNSSTIYDTELTYVVQECTSLQVTENSSGFKKFVCGLANFFSVIVLGLIIVVILGGIGAVVNTYSCGDIVLHIILPFALTEFWDAIFPGMLWLMLKYTILNSCGRVDASAYVADDFGYAQESGSEDEDGLDKGQETLP
jgi:hypothetical protein